ncbi:hypothetical protein [Nostoc commune]|uniref:hypothetical protein n=1 Tax=Nostoc commune TaxID=1178 RepID=UPI0018C68428|nr:hypothetical protein [Nostoc commune]
MKPPKVEPQVTGKRNKKKIDSSPATKPHIPFQHRLEEPELPPEPFQHMQFLDCNLEVGRVIFDRVLSLPAGDNQRVHWGTRSARVQRTTKE